MKDTPGLTRTLLGLYSGDALLAINFRGFLLLSGLSAMSRGSRILDCGCASGNFLTLLASEGFANLTGLDAAEEMADVARWRTGLPVICADALELDAAFPSGAFDAVLAMNLQHHIGREPQWERFIAACHRVLARGGTLFLREPYSTLSFNVLWRLSFHPFFFQFPMLRKRLDSLVDERELLAYFLQHWPAHYASCLSRNGFAVRREISWMGHRIVVATAL